MKLVSRTVAVAKQTGLAYLDIGLGKLLPSDFYRCYKKIILQKVTFFVPRKIFK
jgi:hypothetical protein